MSGPPPLFPGGKKLRLRRVSPVERVHGTCVAIESRGGWHGVLLRGPSGAGKSDLALRLIDRGARLVADDQTELRAASGGLRARPPAAIAGRMEVRGVGLVSLEHMADVPVGLVCDLSAPSQVPRLPVADSVRLDGIAVPRLLVAPFESSAAAKVRLGLDAALQGILGA